MRKIIPIVVITIVLLSLAFRSENETQAQNDSKNVDSAQTENAKGIAAKENVGDEAEKVSNIKDGLKFNNEKPAVLSIINSEKLNLKVVGLIKGQVMSKHKAGLKSTLIVLEGKMEFVINDEKFVLNELDIYEIPVNVEHEIRAIKKTIFSLTQEK